VHSSSIAKSRGRRGQSFRTRTAGFGTRLRFAPVLFYRGLCLPFLALALYGLSALVPRDAPMSYPSIRSDFMECPVLSIRNGALALDGTSLGAIRQDGPRAQYPDLLELLRSKKEKQQAFKLQLRSFDTRQLQILEDSSEVIAFDLDPRTTSGVLKDMVRTASAAGYSDVRFMTRR
jgi:hypothetical protein